VKNLFPLILLLFLAQLSVGQSLEVEVPLESFGVDEEVGIVVARYAEVEALEDLENVENITFILDGAEFEVQSWGSSFSTAEAYLLTRTLDESPYTLYLTEFPLITIGTETPIVDEPKIVSTLTYADDEQVVHTTAGVELRGVTSQTYPKKTYDLEFWFDPENEISEDFQFAQMRSDDDWILDALYNEPLRLRSYFAHKLWLDIHTPSYADLAPTAKSGADVEYVEVFVNGSYRGIYTLSEQVDRKQLQLIHFDGSARGELFKGNTWGATTFSGAPPYSNNNRLWGGHEMKYPRESEMTDWSNLYNFVTFVLDADNESFEDQIWNRFEKENLQHYFIFLNLLRATDNTGKNIFTARYDDGQPYFYVPWDLDGCFGTIWDGSNEDITNGILSNGMINKVLDLNPDGFTSELAVQWFDLREGLLSTSALMEGFMNQYETFDTHLIYQRESLAFPEFSGSQQELDYLMVWLEGRLAFLDEYFDNFLFISKLPRGLQKLKLYPNPATSYVSIAKHEQYLGQTYRLTNAMGQEVYSGVLRSQRINLSNFSKGLYIFQIGKEVGLLVVD
jgi:hypothetical protein